MRDRPTRKLSAILQREEVESRWESQNWQLLGVVPDVGGEVRTIVKDERTLQRLFPGFVVTLFDDEAEGYYLNLSSQKPFVFVNWLEEEGAGVPKSVTVSYNEAARLMDAGARVDGVPMPPQWIPWLAEYVERNYKPEPKKRSRPQSFKGAKRDDR